MQPHGRAGSRSRTCNDQASKEAQHEMMPAPKRLQQQGAVVGAGGAVVHGGGAVSSVYYCSPAKEYNVGERVEVWWDGDAEGFAGEVKAVNGNGSYRILYDDGDVEAAVLKHDMRPQSHLTMQLPGIKTAVVIVGIPGAGKTWTLLELLKGFEVRGIPLQAQSTGRHGRLAWVAAGKHCAVLGKFIEYPHRTGITTEMPQLGGCDRLYGTAAKDLAEAFQPGGDLYDYPAVVLDGFKALVQFKKAIAGSKRHVLLVHIDVPADLARQQRFTRDKQHQAKSGRECLKLSKAAETRFPNLLRQFKSEVQEEALSITMWKFPCSQWAAGELRSSLLDAAMDHALKGVQSTLRSRGVVALQVQPRPGFVPLPSTQHLPVSPL
jgi:hypothetical protein